MILAAGLILTKRLSISKSASLLRFASSSTRLFTEKHEWITLREDNRIGRIGISNHAQEALGDVVYVQVPEIGANFGQFDEVGAIESVKAASELVAPVSGEISTVNTKLEEKPGLVNSDCYGEGWLYEMKIKDSKELEKLMDEDKYNKYLEESKDS